MGLPPVSVAGTIAANAFNFKRLVNGCETKVRGPLPDQFIDVAIVQFRNRPAFAADQKLSSVRRTRVWATDKRIEGIQAVD